MAFIKAVSFLCACSLILSSTAGVALLPTSADKLLQLLDLPGPGGRRVDPPQVMLELYSRVSQSSPDSAQLPHGATTVTAVPASVEEEGKFHFVLPSLHQDEEVVGVEFHMHHGHLLHFAALSHRGLTLQVEAQIYGTESSSTQILSDPATGWYKFPLQASDVVQFYNEEDASEKFPLTIRTRFTTNNGETVNLKPHRRKASRNQASLLIIFSRKRTSSLDKNNPDIWHREDQKELITHRAKRSLFSDLSESSSNTSRSFSSTPSECYRRPLTINFSQIGWSSWIIAPTSFDAFYCSGSCGFPIGQDMNPTNHAVVQSVARLLNENLPTPHCVPSSYSSLSILYVDSFENVVLKSYEQMIADSCGCH